VSLTTLNFARELASYVGNGGEHPLSFLLTLGARASNADAVCLYWRLREQVISPRLPAGNDQVHQTLRQQVRRELWPWLLRQTPSLQQVMLAPESPPIAGLPWSLLVLPLRDEHQELVGLVVLHLSRENRDRLLHNWQAEAADYTLQIIHQLYRHLDRDTGLPGPAVFAQEAHQWLCATSTASRRACLLTLQLDTVHTVTEAFGEDTARIALRDMLGFMETRLRARDLTGRTASCTLSVLLKLCSPSDAERVATALVDTLTGYQFLWNGHAYEPAISTRVKALSAHSTLAHFKAAISSEAGAAPWQSVARHLPQEILPTEPTAQISHTMQERQANHHEMATHADRMVPGELVQPRSVTVFADNVVSLHGSRLQRESVTHEGSIPAGPDNPHESATQPIRIQPCIRTNGDPGVVCYLLRSQTLQQAGTSVDVSVADNRAAQVHKDRTIAYDQRLIASVLNVLTLDPEQHSNTALPMFVVGLQAGFLSEANVEWLIAACHARRVANNALCLSVTETGISARLRDSLPALRRLHRAGFGLMLETGSYRPHSYTLLRCLQFNFIRPPIQLVDAACRDRFRMSVLTSQIRFAHGVGAEVVCGGVDTAAMMQQCQAVGVDIGYGRACGRSVSLASVTYDR